MDIIVELHECVIPDISRKIAQRFAATHDVEMIFNRSIHFPLEDIFGANTHIEHFANMVVTLEGSVPALPLGQ